MRIIQIRVQNQVNTVDKYSIFYIASIVLVLSGLVYQIVVQVLGISLQYFCIISYCVYFLIYLTKRLVVRETENKLYSNQLLCFAIWASLYFLSMQFYSSKEKIRTFGFNLNPTCVFIITLFTIKFASGIYLQYSSSNSHVKLARLLLFVSIINAILSVRALLNNPSIIRAIAGRTGDTIGFSINIIGVAGYPIVYATAIIFPFVIGGIKILKGIYKIISIFIAALLFIYVYASALATAIIVLLIGIVFVAFFSMKKFKRLLVLPLILILAAIIFNTDILAHLIADTAAYIEIPQYQQKLSDIANTIYTEEATGSVEGRSDRYKKSFNSFISNPLYGVGFNKNGDVNIGGHATILDIFGLLGIMGGLPFLLFIYYCYCICKELWENTVYTSYVKASFLNFIVVATLKSIMSSYAIFITIILLIPIIPSYIENIRLRRNHEQR